jgi:hypothetical protein
MILYIVPLVLYYYLFKTHVYHLTAGGIMFIYLTMMLAFMNRYLREVIAYHVTLKIGLKSHLKLKSLHPRNIPKGSLSSREVRRIEGLSMVLVFCYTVAFFFMSYRVLGDVYQTKALLGSAVLSTMIFWKNIQYMIKTIEYKKHQFEYNSRTLKIYQK